MLYNYIKIAFRNLRRHRSFAALSILGLGLSIGCCILIFLLVHHHLTIDRHHPFPDRTLLVVTESKGEVNSREGNVPYPMGAALRQEYAFLDKVTMLSGRHNSLVTLTQDGSAPIKFKEENVRAFAEPAFFEIFNFPLVQGSLAAFQQPNTALLTENMARKYFGTTDALGQIGSVNNTADYQVVGILKNIPPNTDFQFEIYCSWSTLSSDPDAQRMLNNWGGIYGGTQCFATLREGHSIQELENALVGLREKYFHPEVREFFYHAAPLAQVHFDPDLGVGVRESYIWALALIGLFLLLTACVNFVNMATAQAITRAREVGIRKAIGSTRGQLFWQFMSETGLIVGFSVVIGILSAYFSLPFINNILDSRLTMAIDNPTVFYGFLGLLAALVILCAGAYPGMVLSGFKPTESLKSTDGGKQSGGFSLRRVLVGVQFALSQVLIIGVITVAVQVDYARNADLGFQREGIARFPIQEELDIVKQNSLRQRLGQVTGIESVSLCSQAPASDDNWITRVRLEGRLEPENWETNLKIQDHHYIETFGLQLMAGRNIAPSDTVRELLVNEEMVRKLGFASPEEILGKTLFEGRRGYPVVGVVKNFHNRSFHEPIQPQLLLSNANGYDNCVIRFNLNRQKAALAEVEKIWTGVFPDAYFEYEFMDAQLSSFYEQERMLLQLLWIFASIAVFIGGLGLFGLAAFLVTRKRKEIGIRKTLGATVSGILWLFGKEYTRLLLIAFVISAPIAWWAMNRWLSNFTFRITMGVDIFGAALLLTFLIAALTVGVQSVRAALTNPVKSLRNE